MLGQNGGRIPREGEETVVEKTDRPKQASGRSQAGKTAGPAATRTAKKSARNPGTTAAVASRPKKTATGKGRNRAAKAAIEDPTVAKEELAARRIAGGREPEAAASNTPENQHPNPLQAPAAKIDGGTAPAEAQGKSGNKLKGTSKNSHGGFDRVESGRRDGGIGGNRPWARWVFSTSRIAMRAWTPRTTRW